MPPGVRYTSLVHIHLEAGRRTGKGAEEGYKERSTTGGARIWRAPQEIEAANIDIQKNMGRPDKRLQIYEQHLWHQHQFIFSWKKIQNQIPQQGNKETAFQAKHPTLLLQPESHWLVEQVAQRSGWRIISRRLKKKKKLDHHFRTLDNPILCQMSVTCEEQLTKGTSVPNSAKEDICIIFWIMILPPVV